MIGKCVFFSVVDDIENDGATNKRMVSSMNGASKFSKSQEEEQELGGIIYTKNLEMNQKIPEKIREWRNEWLLVEKDKEYEDSDTGDFIDAMYEHINEMY